MKQLPTLCPQTYDGMTMRVEICDRCSNWTGERCGVPTGSEHLDLVEIAPGCPISNRCQHSVQDDGLCAVRARGLVCVSAMVAGGMNYDEAMEHPKAFHADFFEVNW